MGKNQQRNKEESTSGGEEPRSQRRGGGLQPNAAGRLWVPRTVGSEVTGDSDKGQEVGGGGAWMLRFWERPGREELERRERIPFSMSFSRN